MYNTILSQIKDYSIISLDIKSNDTLLGKLSVVSPKRMDYSKTISTLKYINSKFKNLLLENKEGGKDGRKRKIRRNW